MPTRQKNKISALIGLLPYSLLYYLGELIIFDKFTYAVLKTSVRPLSSSLS
jgi:hypothetical protein